MGDTFSRFKNKKLLSKPYTEKSHYHPNATHPVLPLCILLPLISILLLFLYANANQYFILCYTNCSILYVYCFVYFSTFFDHDHIVRNILHHNLLHIHINKSKTKVSESKPHPYYVQ